MKFTLAFALLTSLLLGSTMSYANNHTCTALYTYNGKVFKFTETRTTKDEASKAAMDKCEDALKSHKDTKDTCVVDSCN